MEFKFHESIMSQVENGVCGKMNELDQVVIFDCDQASGYEYEFHKFIMSYVESGMCGHDTRMEFNSRLARGYLKNRIVEFKEFDVQFMVDVFGYLLELYVRYIKSDEDKGSAEYLGIFIGEFLGRYENSCIGREATEKLDNILVDFVKELS